MLRTTALVLAALMLGACSQGYVYMRADGRDLGEDPALYKQFETDRMTCPGEGHGTDVPSSAAYRSSGPSGDNGRDCMTGKGYLVAQSDVAEMKREEIAAQAAEKAQREAAAAAPPPSPPKRVAAKPKPKPNAKAAPPRRRPSLRPGRQAGPRRNRGRRARHPQHQAGPHPKLRRADRATANHAVRK
jgi:hypothetical protein